jgi:hypothetical protein
MQRDDNRKQKYELLWTSRDVTAICAFRFVIFITSGDPARETGPKRRGERQRLDAPPSTGGPSGAAGNAQCARKFVERMESSKLGGLRKLPDFGRLPRLDFR